MTLVVDTGPLVAALNRHDPDHAACAAVLTEEPGDLVVPGLVLAEVDYFCHRGIGSTAWLTFIDDVIAGAYRVEWPTTADLERARDLQAQYADLVLGVVDASVIALAERLGQQRVTTLDHRHFSVVRPRHTAAFTIVP